jgi:SAM-dependent methyltransferase
LIAAVRRVGEEQMALGQALTEAGRTRDAETAIGVRSRLYRDRGLSLDTSLAPNFAVAQALSAIKARGLLTAHSIARAAIVGAGLDFADKNAGFDFYPVETVQPFAVLDAVGRLGLATGGSVPDVVCFDISPRVLAHVDAARRRADNGRPYTLNLALPRQREFVPEFRRYWMRFGQSVATVAHESAATFDHDAADVRAIVIPPSTVRRVSALDLNIVTQRFDAEPPFDLIVATNVLVYYDAFDQAVALANIASMLRPGGIFLTNTPLPDVPGLRIVFAGSTTVRYDTRGTGDDVLWYRRR